MKILDNSKFNKSIVVLTDFRHTLARRKTKNLQVLNILASTPSENTFKNSFKNGYGKSVPPWITVTRRFRYYLSRIACNLDFSSLLNFAMVVALDRGPHGGYATISVESLVALGITPLELRFGSQIAVYSAVAPLSQWNRL